MTTLRSVYERQSPTGTITLPPRHCWVITNPLVVQGMTHLTIDGNGDVIEEPAIPAESWSPMLALYQDVGLTVKDLVLAGPGVSGGAGGEGDYGIVAEADVGLTLDAVDMEGIRGDFLLLGPTGVNQTGIDPAVEEGPNRDVTVTHCAWVGAGYHGVTIEAVHGATFRHDTFADVAVDTIDLEYDGGVRAADPMTGPGWPQTSIAFTDDRFVDDEYVLLNVANTGSTLAGLIDFSDNRLSGSTQPIFDISGVPGANPVRGVAITDNTAEAPTSGPDPNDTVHLTDVDGATVTGNRFHYYWYVQPAGQAKLTKTAVIADGGSRRVQVEGNDFRGAAVAAVGAAVDCGNTYGVSAYQDRVQRQARCHR